MAVIDRILDGAATVIIRLVDYMQERRDKQVRVNQPPLPPLSKPLPELSIEDAVRKANAARSYRAAETLQILETAARADLEARRKSGE